MLLHDAETTFAQLMGQRIPVDFFQKSRSECVQDLERAADDALRQFVDAGFICGYLRHLRPKFLCTVRAAQTSPPRANCASPGLKFIEEIRLRCSGSAIVGSPFKLRQSITAARRGLTTRRDC